MYVRRRRGHIVDPTLIFQHAPLDDEIKIVADASSDEL